MGVGSWKFGALWLYFQLQIHSRGYITLAIVFFTLWIFTIQMSKKVPNASEKQKKTHQKDVWKA